MWFTRSFRAYSSCNPHIRAEFGRGGAFDRMDSLEDRLQIESRVLADDADIDPLPVAEPVGNFRHREALVLAAPVVRVASAGYGGAVWLRPFPIWS